MWPDAPRDLGPGGLRVTWRPSSETVALALAAALMLAVLAYLMSRAGPYVVRF